jgi:hypothetical protein
MMGSFRLGFDKGFQEGAATGAADTELGTGRRHFKTIMRTVPTGIRKQL